MNSNFSIKKSLIIIIAAFVAINVGISTISYLRDGSLKVNTSDPSAVISIINGKDGKLKKIGSGDVSIKLPAGRYLVKAQKEGSQSQSAVTVRARQTSFVNLKLHTALAPTTISHDVARDLRVIGTDSLVYLNAPYHQLFQYSPSLGRSIRYHPEVYPLNKVDWLSNGGAIINTGSDSVSYLDAAGKVTSIDTDLRHRDSDYVVSTNGNIVYVSNGWLVLKRMPQTSVARLIHLPAGSYNLAMSNDGKYVLVATDVSGGDAPNPNKNFRNYIVQTSSPNNYKSFTTNSAITSSAWSSNNMLAYSIDSQIHTYNPETLDDKDLNLDFQKTQPTLINFINNNDLVYTLDQIMWDVDINGTQSFELSSYQGVLTAQGFTFNSSSKTVYYSTDPDVNGNGGEIYKLKL